MRLAPTASRTVTCALQFYYVRVFWYLEFSAWFYFVGSKAIKQYHIFMLYPYTKITSELTVSPKFCFLFVFLPWKNI